MFYSYVKYFSNLLLGVTKVNTSSISLTQITFSRLFPETNVIIKIYERMKLVYTSNPLYVLKIFSLFKHILFSIIKEFTKFNLVKHISFGSVSSNGYLALRGDILLKCFLYNPNTKETNHLSINDLNIKDRKILFQCQFNSCALDFYSNKSSKNLSKNQVGRLVFFKEELDRIFAGIFFFFKKNNKTIF